MNENWDQLYQDFIEDIFGDGQIPYIYDDFCDGAWQFMEYLKNQSPKESAKT